MLLSLGQSSPPNSACRDEEFAFLHAVEFCDVSGVRRLLGDHPTLNVDVIDALGRSALRLAVRNENKELVELLLALCNNENIQQAALQAISENHTAIAELILVHPSYMQIWRKRKRLGDTDGFFKMEVESQFSTDMTPINLAAQKNNYAIVRLLLQRGDTIPKPDRFDCSCLECRNRMKFDQLRLANFRLNAYRGLASEAYIAMSSEDPFLTAFQLAKELRKLSDDEIHFKKQYKDLANQLSQFVVRLLDRVWTQQELQMVLNKKGAAYCEKYESLARLKLALENKEKKFVAHPSVQQYLVEIWHGSLQALDTLPVIARLTILAILAIFYPFIYIGHLVSPGGKCSKLAQEPMVKFLGHTASFFVFLLLIIMSSAESSYRVSNEITLYTKHPGIAQHYRAYRDALGQKAVPYGEDFPLRPHVPTVTEYLITIWIAGMFVQELQQVCHSGVLVHFNDLFNAVDFCVLVFYITAFTLNYWTMRMSTMALDMLHGQNVTSMLGNRKQTDLYLYWLNTDRQHWEEYDPSNIAEGMFAMANIISFSRIFYLLPANEMLGPMQISLGRMINDILKFLVFCMLAIAGFLVSLRNLYWWYSGTLNLESPKPSDNVTNAATSFLNIRKQFITVFWWIYGRGPMNKALDLPLKYQNGQITETVGNILAALYHVIIILVLVNLLIAMMARSFERTVDDIDAEWKYARSLLYMEYITDNCAPPIPFNIFMPLRDVISAVISYARHCKDEDEATPPALPPVERHRRGAFPDMDYNGSVRFQRGQRDMKKNRLKYGSGDDEPPTYKSIAQTIVQRYIFDIQREEEIVTGKLEEARQNIFHTKSELLEMLEERDGKVCQLNTTVTSATSALAVASLSLPHIGASLKRRARRSICLAGDGRQPTDWAINEEE